MTDGTLWFLGAYAVGTGFGWYLGLNHSVRENATVVIDHLIKEGYLRTRMDSQGNTEILKLDEE